MARTRKHPIRTTINEKGEKVRYPPAAEGPAPKSALAVADRASSKDPQKKLKENLGTRLKRRVAGKPAATKKSTKLTKSSVAKKSKCKTVTIDGKQMHGIHVKAYVRKCPK
jgi:hypothetical protein